MEMRIVKDMIAVIRAEEKRRASLLTDEHPEVASNQWLFRDEPFVNELCLMLLVALRHQVERELVGLAARAADDGKEISPQEYDEQVQRLRNGKRWDWKTIKARLSLESCGDHTSMEALRLLANSYKHHASKKPDEELLTMLKLEAGVNYAPLPESHSLQEGLGAFVGLGKDAAYCDIAERFLDIAGGFLVDVRSRTKVSPVKWGGASLNPDDFAR